MPPGSEATHRVDGRRAPAIGHIDRHPQIDQPVNGPWRPREREERAAIWATVALRALAAKPAVAATHAVAHQLFDACIVGHHQRFDDAHAGARGEELLANRHVIAVDRDHQRRPVVVPGVVAVDVGATLEQ